MADVVRDQEKFLVMDPTKPAPPMIIPKVGEGGGGGAGGSAGGC
jgi:hypothetical protein